MVFETIISSQLCLGSMTLVEYPSLFWMSHSVAAVFFGAISQLKGRVCPIAALRKRPLWGASAFATDR